MRPNWPLVGIIAGAVLALAAVITIFVTTASSGSATIATVPTTEQLDAKHAAWSTAYEGTVALQNGCLFATVDGAARFVIWPKGYAKDGDAVRADDGTLLSPGDAISGTGTLLSRADALAASDAYSQYLDDMTSRCLGGAAGAADAVLVLETATH